MITALLCVVLAAPAPVKPASRPALEQLARGAADRAKALPAEAPVGVFVDGTPPALARALASLVAAELAALQLAPVVLDAPSPADAEHLARKQDVRTLIRLTVTVEAEQAWARGDVISTWVNFWSGATPSRSGAAAAIALLAPLDPQTRALAQSAPTPPASPTELSLSTSVWVRLPSPPLAIAALDVDGDKRAEVAVLLDDALLLFAPEAKLLARAELKTVPLLPSPSRDPLGTVALFANPTRVSWSSTRRQRGELLTWAPGQLKPAGAMPEPSIDGATVKPLPGLNTFAAALTLGGKPLDAGAPFTATSTRGAVTLLVYPDGAAALLRGQATPARFHGAGAGSTLVDLDGDGTPEVALSSTRFFPDADELRVLSLQAAEALQARGAPVLESTPLWRGTTPRGRAIVAAGADLDADGAEELLVGAWLADGAGEIQIVRRAK